MASASLLELGYSPYINHMNGDQIASLVYFGLLGTAIVGSYIVANRKNLGQVAQHAAIWGLIFVGVIGAIGIWPDISHNISPRQSVVSAHEIALPQARDGHYYVTLDINGVPVDFVVDTGASQVVLSQDDARRVGINPDTLRYLGSANTANGVVSTASVTLNTVTLENFRDSDVRAVVNGGPMDGSLLGMTYLQRFDQIAISGNEMILSR